jgi:hypothetical protein
MIDSESGSDEEMVACVDERLNKGNINQLRFQRTNTNACLIVPNHFRITPMSEVEGKMGRFIHYNYFISLIK